MRRFWLFQANPKYSQILEAIQKLDGIYWLVTRYDKEITPGDRVLIWIAGKQAGVYAIAQVSEAPQFMDEPLSKTLHIILDIVRIHSLVSIKMLLSREDVPL
jgi:EVE domain